MSGSNNQGLAYPYTGSMIVNAGARKSIKCYGATPSPAVLGKGAPNALMRRLSVRVTADPVYLGEVRFKSFQDRTTPAIADQASATDDLINANESWYTIEGQPVVQIQFFNDGTLPVTILFTGASDMDVSGTTLA